DIAPLAARFLAEFAARNGRPVHGISADALAALEAYSWPGNVRELRNVIERAVALCPGREVGADDLPDAIRSARQGGVALSGMGTLARTKEEAEAVRIVSTLKKHRNNRLRAAAELGISRWTLYKKLHRYGLIGVGED